MELSDALAKIKYPEDKYVDEKTDDQFLLGFNEGWNELRSQLDELVLPKGRVNKEG